MSHISNNDVKTTKVTSEQSHTCTHDADISVLQQAVLDIKNVLQDMSELLTSNAVLEEQANQFRETIKSFGQRLGTLEIRVATMKGSDKWIEKAVWAIVASAITFFLSKHLPM